METEIKIFISYLHNTKRMSGNTVVSYERDLRKMMQYFQEAHQITRVQDITETSLNSYMLYLEKNCKDTPKYQIQLQLLTLIQRRKTWDITRLKALLTMWHNQTDS